MAATDEVSMILAEESIDTEEAMLVLLRLYLDGRLELSGGYPAEIDATTFPDKIVVADLDHDGGPVVRIWDREELLDLTWESLDDAILSDDGETLPPDEAASAALDFFCEKASHCELVASGDVEED